MNKYQVSLFFICLVISNLNNCSQENGGLFKRNKELHPKSKNAEKKISVYGVKVDDENRGLCCQYFKNLKINIQDYTCLHRVYTASIYLVEELSKQSPNYEALGKKLIENPNVPLRGILPFDAFVNPQLYSSICRAEGLENEESAKRIVYFNSSHNRPPIAGCHATSYISPSQYKAIQVILKNNMQQKERWFCKSDDHLDAALCFNSDYKELLAFIREMQKENNYQFACVTTRWGSYSGHALAFVVDKRGDDVKLIGMDGANLLIDVFYGEYIFIKIFDLLNDMIISPKVLENLIVRYVYAIKSDVMAQEEIRALGLSHNDLYRFYSSYFNCLYQLLNEYNLISLLSLVVFMSLRVCSNGN